MEVITWNIVPKLEANGYYYFTVAAVGDGVQYADSPYVVSDVFEYTGEEAPPLAAPTGLAWRLYEIDDARRYYATWDNLDGYEGNDFFNVTFYDQAGDYLMNNTWSKREIVERGYGGIPIRAEFLPREARAVLPSRYIPRGQTSTPQALCRIPLRRNTIAHGCRFGRKNEIREPGGESGAESEG